MAHGGGFDLRAGDLFNERYEIVRPLSVGGMGAVYEALHLETRRRRALKLMRPELLEDAGARARFKLEAQVAANIESEHIVEVVDAGVDPRSGAPFIVMELLRGEDLGAVIAKRGRLPAAEVVDVLAQAARALGRTHAAGIVHRDLKPENLFVTIREDGSSRIKVLDFGIAKVVEESRHQTHATASIGTPVFMAPEQISGAPLGPAADIYALGQIGYSLLAGSAYWDVEAQGVNVYSLLVKIAAGAREPAVVRAARAGVTLPAAFEGWFARATALAPEARFGGAGELVAALAEALALPAPFIPRTVQSSLLDRAEVSGAAGATAGGATGYDATIAVGTEAPRRRRLSLLLGAAGLCTGLVVGVVRFVVMPWGSGETGMLELPGTAAAGDRLSGGSVAGAASPATVPGSSAGAATAGLEAPSASAAQTAPSASGAATTLPQPRVEPAARGALPTSGGTGAASSSTTAAAKASSSPSVGPHAPAVTKASTSPSPTTPAVSPLLTR